MKDVITRTYYNASNTIIGSQLFVVTFNNVMTQDQNGAALITPDSHSIKRFARTGDLRLIGTTKQFHSDGTSRAVAKVVTEGGFSSSTTDLDGDIATITYDGDDLTNSLSFALNTMTGVIKEGDTI